MADSAHDNPRELARRMVRGQIIGRGVEDDRVLEAMRRVPRHRFAPGHDLHDAYADRALPIGLGQTISQPYMVARMTELLRVRPGHRVLEIGTGSGYQAAVLLEMGAVLTTVERIGGLADAARALLDTLYPDAEYKVLAGDGSTAGVIEGRYDRVLVTAGAPGVPEALKDRLADGGRMVIPTGPRDSQVLTVCQRAGDHWTVEDDITCRFVPLLGEGAWPVGEADED